MTLADLNLSPATLDTLAAHEVDDIDTLRAVLADPEALKTLGLPAGPLAKLRASLGVTSAGLAAAVELVEPHTMPLADLIRRVIARPQDTAALDVAMRRAPMVAVRGVPSRDTVDVAVTCAYLDEMARVPTSMWPGAYRGCDIRSWADVVPESRPIWCPLTREPVIEGRTSMSGLAWAVPPKRWGFLAFLATQPNFRAHHTDKQILTDVASGTYTTDPEYAAVRMRWGGLVPSACLAYAESLYAESARALPEPASFVTVPGASLYDVVLSCMSNDEMRILLQNNPDLRPITHRISGSPIAPATLVREVLSACERLGVLPIFVDALCRARPRREADIRNAR